ncbi:antitoxin family protein [Nostoc sp.]|uniref:antitoxin family protein n=1 Tax=Nostoc sp. TaxID=1180 RepID=UPI002FF6A3EB
MTIEAVYEQKVIRLSQPILLAEGTRVEVTVISDEAKPKHKTSREILAEIATMPLEVSNDKFSGGDHDTILYPVYSAVTVYRSVRFHNIKDYCLKSSCNVL